MTEARDPLAELDRILRTCFNCKRDKKDSTTPPCHYCKPLPNYPLDAPDGQLFICGACGRFSKNLYGVEGSSWDESCMMNAVLCYENSVELDDSGRLKNAKAVEGY